MKKEIIVKQNDSRDCGICCLESIIKYYNGFIPLETLRIDTNTNQRGTTALNLVKTAKKYGFNAYGIKAKEIDSNKIILPAIAHIQTKKGLNHFVVLYKITKKHIFIMDPDKGYVKRKRNEFENEWTNVILILKPYTKIPYYKTNNLLKSIGVSVLKDNVKIISKLIIFNVIITILSIISSYYLKISLDGIENNELSYLKYITILFLIINIIKISLEYLKNELIIYFEKNIDVRIIPDFLNHIFHLPTNVISSRTSGEILKRINDLNNVKNLFSEIIVSVLLDIILIICSSLFLFNLSKELFFILCIISILLITTGRIGDLILHKKISENIDLETEFNSEVTEKIDNIESIKNLNITNKILFNLDDSFLNYVKSYFEYNNSLNKILVIKKIIITIGLFIIDTIGIYMMYNKTFDLITLITFTSLLSYFINPLEEIINIIPKFRLIELSVDKCKNFLNIEEEKEGKEEIFTNGDIIIKNLSYSYDNYNKILNNLNLIIPKNERILIKGDSGCGKSTICKIISRSIENYKGLIEINGINIKDYSLKTIRNNILYISQREKIFSDTIRNNICLNNKIGQEKLNEIIKITKIDEIINKHELRLETYLFDSGFNLSGGERQRIILARAIVKKPKILILDESLSEVEEDMEMEIINNIKKYLTDTTIIYISHKSHNIFDNVINLKAYE